MNRLLIESIEGRILVGITMFVAIMILIGWVAINEPARMAAFERQHLGRSIERGAELFGANCATCHAADGRGIAGRAPGLNSPHLFGVDFLAAINSEIAPIERNLAELVEEVTLLNEERDQLLTEISTLQGDAQTQAISRIQAINNEIDAAVEGTVANRIAQLEDQLQPLYEAREAQLAQLEPAIVAGYYPQLEVAREQAESQNNPFLLTQYLSEDADRLAQMGWEGSLQGFLTTTLYHGRPGSGDVWGGNQMVAWGQVGGGPLRYDQVDDLVNYILNWDQGDAWDLEDLYAVNQFGKVKQEWTAGGADAAPSLVSQFSTDVPAMTEAVVSLTGDPVRGQELYNAQQRTELNQILGCSSCHLGGAQAPATEETWSNVVNIRLNDPTFSGYTAEQYLVESITYPNDYVVDGYASGVMPQTYGEQMTAQDMADVIAYLRSYAEE